MFGIYQKKMCTMHMKRNMESLKGSKDDKFHPLDSFENEHSSKLADSHCFLTLSSLSNSGKRKKTRSKLRSDKFILHMILDA